MAASDLKWACRAAHAGVTGYLGTPFNEDQLCPAIGMALNRYQALQALAWEAGDLRTQPEERTLGERATGLV